MDKLEEQCHEELCEICDIREQYPAACAEEFGKIIKLNNNVQIAKVNIQKSELPKVVPTAQELSLLKDFEDSRNSEDDNERSKLAALFKKIQDFNKIYKQIAQEKTCPMSKCLKGDL